ncbi:MAG: transglycosylase SLT domain-containing protein [Bacteriovoracaceae bacterium]|jgi:soluble lytic murein transglycosylase|nr:transglycosylase SLT domain-containing protein [Bacteriovoracaceae bacterium]
MYWIQTNILEKITLPVINNGTLMLIFIAVFGAAKIKVDRSDLSVIPSIQTKTLNAVDPSIKPYAKKYLPYIIELSHKYSVDPAWVISKVWVESHFRYRSKSHKGASGLMQIMPSTYKYLYNKYQSKLSYRSNDLIGLELGVLYFWELKKKFNDYKLASIAYNMGPTWTMRNLNNGVGKNNHYLNKIVTAYNKIQVKL